MTEQLPLLCLRDEAERGLPGRIPLGDDDREAARQRTRFLCGGCRARISDRSAVFSPDGEAEVRVFTNPEGLVCQVLTVTRAESLVLIGPATTEHTWFPGYAWRVALCSQCLAHLGWRYEAIAAGTAPADFFGLLVTQLVEEHD